MAIPRLFRSAYFRWPALRALIGATNGLMRSRRVGTGYLAAYEEGEALGPLQRDEALLLHALVRVTAPRTIVEFGFANGHSALVFLEAGTRETLVASYDIDPVAAKRARRRFGNRGNFRLVQKSQADFDPADVDGRPVDLAFIDASHDFDLNRRTFEKLLPALADDAVVAVHDTGTWARAHMGPRIRAHLDGAEGHWIDAERYAHAPGERRFVNWIASAHPAFGTLHLHSAHRLRHGLTLLQRRLELD